jgi:DNA topoisomerase-1
MKYLVIVESPAKVSKIQKILSEANDGNQYQVAATVGHILSLNSEKTLGVDLADRYRPDYVPHPEKKDVIANIRALAKRVDKVIIASDLDQEGEFIGYSICHLVGIAETTTPRIIFNEITKNAILKAIKTQGQLDFNVLDAQKCRRISDRLIGFLITRAAKSINPKLTVGRVQTIMVKLVIDREKEIENFQKTLSYHTAGYFNSTAPQNNEIETRLSKVFDSHDDIESFLKICATPNTKFHVKSLTDKINSKNPPAPLITSTLQSLVSRSLGISPKEVMDTAQRLYQEGLISYPRTDCPKLPEEKMDECASFILNKYGEKYHERRVFKSTDQSAQEAHSCIYPTKIQVESLEQLTKEGNSEFEYNSRMQRVYRFVWLYAVSSQMSPSETKVTKCTIEVVPEKSPPSTQKIPEFIAENHQLIFEGFQKVWGKTISRTEDDDDNDSNIENPEEEEQEQNTSQAQKNAAILSLKVGDLLKPSEIQSKQKAAQGPTPYNESNLITQMKRYGVGRPSTHGTILSQIMDDSTKGFLYKGNKPGEKLKIEILTWKPRADKTKIMMDETTVTQSAQKNRLYSTELGRAIDNFVNEYFSDIFNYGFTRKLESDMDKIEHGEANWYDVVDKLYKAFAPKLKQFPTWTTKENAENNPARKPKREIGTHNQKNVYAYLGKFGPVLQIGEDSDADRQHIGLPKECNIETVTYEQIEYLFGFPYNLGTLSDGRTVLLKKSKHGLYLDCGSSAKKTEKPVEKTSKTSTNTEKKATYQVTEDMFAGYEPNAPMESQIKNIKFDLVESHIRAADTPKEYLRQINDIKIIKGKYGPYFIFNNKLVGIPKYHNVDIITYDECLQLYASKGGARKKSSDKDNKDKDNKDKDNKDNKDNKDKDNKDKTNTKEEPKKKIVFKNQ